MSPVDIGTNDRKYARWTRESLEGELESLHRQLKKQQEDLKRCSGIEHSLRESEEKYRFLVENSGDVIWKIDVQGRWMFVSSNVEKVTGYRPDEIVGKSIWDFVAPEYHDVIRNMLRKRSLGENIAPYEVDIIAKDGHHMPFEVLTTPIRDNTGRIVGIQGISRDISYRKQAEERLIKYYNELETRVEKRTAELDKALSTLRAILETVPIGIIVADHDTEMITYSSKGVSDIYGSSASGRLCDAQNWPYKLLRPDGSSLPPDELPLVRSLRLGERVRNMEILVRRADGSEVSILASSAPVLDPGGQIMAAVASISDVSCLKRVEAELRDEKEQAELYLDLMGHDINNMNHIAMGYLEMVIDEIRHSGKLDSGKLNLLLKPLEMMNNSSLLIDNVRKIQRIRENELKHETIDLYPMLSEIRSEYSQIPNRDIHICLSGISPAPVIANPLLKDVFTNLVGNAIKHSTGPLRIDIRIGETMQNGKKYYQVAIEDNGPGISPQDKKILLSRKKLGAKGLGLYLVRTFVKKFNGRFWLEDRVPGDHTQGARFVVMLPASSEAAR
ncbi:putative histidine kinase [Methanocella paludicola SANAE]|uniref:histidine kinase n=1 Tax=Methanocella paludicola (strain DSM 17711 / JCM 13418 / NBRC 101707 / SANAE) TaxID=304371 RepID=D1YY57_METPS|nr:PAS domain S-box protein [Methanocella paludicola]BAI61379.1 putative histidine kinase [Methanocella paludicola SANAE]